MAKKMKPVIISPFAKEYLKKKSKSKNKKHIKKTYTKPSVDFVRKRGVVAIGTKKKKKKTRYQQRNVKNGASIRVYIMTKEQFEERVEEINAYEKKRDEVIKGKLYTPVEKKERLKREPSKKVSPLKPNNNTPAKTNNNFTKYLMLIYSRRLLSDAVDIYGNVTGKTIEVNKMRRAINISTQAITASTSVHGLIATTLNVSNAIAMEQINIQKALNKTSFIKVGIGSVVNSYGRYN